MPSRRWLCQRHDNPGSASVLSGLALMTRCGGERNGKDDIVKAIWQDVVLAESDDTVVVEGNHYFPEESLNREYFRESSHRSMCPWKGVASYYAVDVDGSRNENAAWYYPRPSLLARKITGRVAFWNGVRVEP